MLRRWKSLLTVSSKYKTNSGNSDQEGGALSLGRDLQMSRSAGEVKLWDPVRGLPVGGWELHIWMGLVFKLCFH